MSNSLQPYELQHARLPCPSATPRACSNSCLSNQWCHPTISSSVVPFSSCLLSFPSSGSFLISQLFASGGQSIGALTDWFDLCHSRDFQESSPTPHFKSINSSVFIFLMVQLTSIMTTGKTIALTRWTFVVKVTSLLFTMLSRLVITFLPRSKRLLISRLQSPSAVILEPTKIVCFQK